jgi:site-specific DNA-methyltransferase (adenine-specific)
MDCMEYMKDIPDKFFDLAVVDPPYGIGESGGDKKRNRNYKRIVKHVKKEWDVSIPPKEYFDELFRVSQNQIIWGANYMVEHLYPSMGWIYWDKRIGGDFSDGELAWTSFNKALRSFSYSHVGDTKGGHTRIHPTQKPVPLYTWLLMNYAKEGDKILDTHLGSGSSRIAAYNLGFDFTGTELDEEYFNDSVKRFNRHKSQLTLF